MIKTAILVGEGTLLSTVFGPFDLLTQAGVFWNLLAGEPLSQKFDVKISSIDGLEITSLNGAKIQPHLSIDSADEFDLIILPSEGLNIQTDSASFQKRVQYIKTMHNKGSVIASVCTGAFLLAATGLLDGKKVTTHWALANRFRQLYPSVNLDTNLLIADNQSLITAGGVSADHDLSMHLITRFCGQDIALQSARCTLVDMPYREQTPYKTFMVNKNHGDSLILKCQQYIEGNFAKKLSSSLIADYIGLSIRTLNRRFKEATGESVTDYLQRLKIEKAKSFLEKENWSFDCIANELGYENVSFFRRLFKKYVGVSPKEYRRMFVYNHPP